MKTASLYHIRRGGDKARSAAPAAAARAAPRWYTARMARIDAVVEFYERHPINERQVLEALRRRGKVAGALAPEDLYEWDQDHYGGLGAVEALARRAEVGGESLVSRRLRGARRPGALSRPPACGAA